MVEIKGGAKLDAILKELSAKVQKGATVEVGFMSGATEQDGTSIPMIAALNEYGVPSRGQPPRPFFRTAIKNRSAAWGTNLGTALKATNYDSVRALSMVGQSMEEDIKDSIRDLFAPALSEVTIMLRGMRANNPGLVVTGATVGEAAQRVKDGKTNYGASTKPLIDSGDMLRSVTHIVKTK